MKSLNLSTLSLGPLDANDDDNLSEYFVELSGFPDLTGKNLFVVVGPKGTGKSAIKKHLCARRKEQGKLTIEIDDSYGFSLTQIGTTSPAEVKSKMKGYLVALVINHLATETTLSNGDRKKIKKLGQDKPLIQRIVEPLTVKAGVVEYAIKELFPKSKQASLLRLMDATVVTAITKVLDQRDLWIVIDDIDTVFTSDKPESSLRFVEGLIYATSDLCIRAFKRSLWIILLLRSEIYEELLRRATELDKELVYIWEIDWDGKALRQFLGERIRWAADAEPGQQSWKYWRLLFDVSTKEETGKLQEYLLERTINGPRDLLLLVELTRQTAIAQGAKKIHLNHIRQTEYDYGKKKLRQLTSNFQRVYPDIDRVLDRLFRGGAQIYTRASLKKHINENLLTDPNAREDFRGLRWLATSNPFLLIQVLYHVGCIGYWDHSEKRFIYTLEQPSLDKALASNTNLKVHSALAQYLELTPPSLSKKRRAKARKA